MSGWKEADIRRAISSLVSQGYKLKDLLKVMSLMREEQKKEAWKTL